MSSLADMMYSYYQSELGESNSLIDMERKFFINGIGDGVQTRTWADAALAYFAQQNGSSPVGTLYDEAFKYYSGQSGLVPASSYSLTDHMSKVYTDGGPSSEGGGAITFGPPVTDNLEAFFSADYILGFNNDKAVSPNKFSFNQASAEIDMTGIGTAEIVSPNCTATRITTQFLDGAACVQMNSAASGDMKCQWGLEGSRVEVTAGQEYTASVLAMASGTARNLQLSILWYSAATGGYLSTDFGDSIPGSFVGYVRSFITATAPVGATHAALVVIVKGCTASNEKIYVDCVAFNTGADRAYSPPGKLINENLLTLNQATVETDTTGFRAGTASPTLTRSTTKLKSGVASLRAQAASAATFTVEAVDAGLSILAAVTAGKVYTGAVSSIAGTTGRSIRVGIRWLDATKSTLSTDYGVAYTSNSASNIDLRVSAVAPVGAVFAYLVAEVASAGNTELHYFDEWGLWEGYQQGWVIPYGDVADNSTIEFWRDISGRGRSTIKGNTLPVVRKAGGVGTDFINLLTYQQATLQDGSATGWSAGANTTVAYTNVQALNGRGCLKATASGSGTLIFYTLSGTSAVPVVEGRTYTAVAYVRSAVSVRKFKCRIRWFDAAGSFISDTSPSDTDSTTSSWTKITSSGEAPAGAAFACVRITTSDTSSASEEHYLDNIGLTEGSNNTWAPPTVLFNDKAGVQFLGGTYNLKIPRLPLLAQSEITVYAVVAQDDQAIPYCPYQATGSQNFYMTVTATSRIPFSTCNAGGATGPALPALKSASILTLKNTPTDTYVYTNGVGGTHASDPTQFLGPVFYVGSSTNAWVGNIMALLIFSGSHSDDERQAVEAWLASVYGITL